MGNSSSQVEAPIKGSSHRNVKRAATPRNSSDNTQQSHGYNKPNTSDGGSNAMIEDKAAVLRSVVTSQTGQTGQTVLPTTSSDVVMDDYSHVEHIESSAEGTREGTPLERPTMPARRKSTLLLEGDHDLDEDLEFHKLKLASEENKPLSRAGSGEEIELNENDYAEGKFDVLISWRQGGEKVYVTGSFTGWRRMIKLRRQDDGTFSAVLKLPPGTHRMRFVVDNELRCSDYLPAATDSMGNLVNYIEVGPDTGSERDDAEQPPAQRARLDSDIAIDDDMEGDGTTSYYGGYYGDYERVADSELVLHEPIKEYNSEIPEVFTNPEVMERFVSSDFVPTPQLPPHLESVILNSNSNEKDNNSILPIPNHVVLNHLATTSIKHNVLAVASISRYSGKYGKYDTNDSEIEHLLI